MNSLSISFYCKFNLGKIEFRFYSFTRNRFTNGTWVFATKYLFIIVERLPALGEEPLSAAAILSCYHGEDKMSQLTEVDIFSRKMNVLKVLPPINCVPLVSTGITNTKAGQRELGHFSENKAFPDCVLKTKSKEQFRNNTSKSDNEDGRYCGTPDLRQICKHQTLHALCKYCTRPPSRGGRVLMEWLHRNKILAPPKNSGSLFSDASQIPERPP